MTPLAGVYHKSSEVYETSTSCLVWEVFYNNCFSLILLCLFGKPVQVIFYYLICDYMIIYGGEDFDGIASLKTTLSHHFAIKDFSVLYYFLSIEFASSSKGYLFFSQFQFHYNWSNKLLLWFHKVQSSCISFLKWFTLATR